MSHVLLHGNPSKKKGRWVKGTSRVVVSCPECGHFSVLSKWCDYPRDGFVICEDGSVGPWFVCQAEKDGKICSFDDEIILNDWRPFAKDE